VITRRVICILQWHSHAGWVSRLLNRDHVRSIQITMAEAFDVADRGGFYDRTGAIRDVLQNHMLQVLASMLAEPPSGLGLGDGWRDAKNTAINALGTLTPEDVVRGQYDGYLQVDGVAPGSTVEPIVIRAGKCLPVTATEITAVFKDPPLDLFGVEPETPPDMLSFRIWPETAVRFTLQGKKPGAGWDAQAEQLSFAQQPGSGIRPYDRLIGAALDGDRWLFARQDTVEAAWRIVDPVLGDVVPVQRYTRGSWGRRTPAGCCLPGIPGLIRPAEGRCPWVPPRPPGRSADLGEGLGQRFEHRRIQRRPQVHDGQVQPHLAERRGLLGRG
jgi:glucose-6-phosphate 1-dehydrogenase